MKPHPLICALLLLAVCLLSYPARPPFAAATETRQAATATDDSGDRPRLVSQLGHSGGVGSVAFSSDGESVLTVATDRSAILWETSSGRELWRYPAEPFGYQMHSGELSPDKRLVVTVNSKKVKLWDAVTGAGLKEFGDGPYVVGCVRFSPDGRYVLMGKDYQARLWEVGSGNEVKTFGEPRAVVSDPCGNIRDLSFSPDGKRILVGYYSGRSKLWDVASGRVLAEFAGHTKPVVGVAFMPGGRRVVTGGSDSTVRVWDIESATEVLRLEGEVGRLMALAVAPDGRYILTADFEGHARFWDVATGRVFRSLRQERGLQAVDISPDGRYVMTGAQSGLSRLWDAETAVELRRFTRQGLMVNSVAVSPRADSLLAATESVVSVWDLETGRRASSFTHGNQVSSVSFSADGNYALTSNYDSTARLWELSTGRQVRQFPTAWVMRCAAISRTGRYVVADAENHSAVLWDAQSGQELRRFKGPPDPRGAAWFNSVAFSQDEKFVLTGGVDDITRMYETATGKEVRVFVGQTSHVNSVAFSSDGRFVLTAAGGSGNAGGRDDSAWLWDAATGKKIRQYIGHADVVTSAVFSPDGRRVLTASWDETARVWDTETGRQLARFEGHSGLVNSAVFFGEFVVTAGSDGTTRVWDTRSGKEACRLITLTNGDWVVTDSSGRFDTNNLDAIQGLHWVFLDDPFRALSPEVFMRDYYEPKLLRRLLDGEALPMVRPLQTLNRAQPSVKVVSVRPGARPDVAEVTVAVSGAGGEDDAGPGRRPTGAYDLRLFRDGQMVAQWPEPSREIDPTVTPPEDLKTWRDAARISPDPAGKATRTFEVRLPHNKVGQSVQFSAYAFNEDRVKSGVSAQEYPVPLGLEPVRPRAYVISMGVNTYQEPGWDLRFAARDASLMQEVLTGALEKRYDVVPISLISDYKVVNGVAQGANNATGDALRTVLRALAGESLQPSDALKGVAHVGELRRAGPDDVVLLTVSSHGYTDGAGRFYLIPSDSGRLGAGGTVGAEQLRQWVSSDELSLWLRGVDAGDLVMVIDTCHSAGAVEEPGFKPGPMGSRGLGQLAYDKGVKVLAASQADDVALEVRSLEHGLLTYALVREGLEAARANADGDGKVTLDEWLAYGAERVPTLYEELRTGRLKPLEIAGRDPIPVKASGARASIKKNAFQQPSLFNFKRKGGDVILAEVSRRR